MASGDGAHQKSPSTASSINSRRSFDPLPIVSVREDYTSARAALRQCTTGRDGIVVVIALALESGAGHPSPFLEDFSIWTLKSMAVLHMLGISPTLASRPLLG